jgi:hypothetical protein
MPTSSGPGKRTGVGAGWLHFSEYSIMLLCVATSVLLLPLVTTIIYNLTKIVCCITTFPTYTQCAWTYPGIRGKEEKDE